MFHKSSSSTLQVTKEVLHRRLCARALLQGQYVLLVPFQKVVGLAVVEEVVEFVLLFLLNHVAGGGEPRRNGLGLGEPLNVLGAKHGHDIVHGLIRIGPRLVVANVE